tara:strand:- start:98 stop:319 length:222 start_codon:yes stop_codon:yes gene_type:complete
MTIDTKIDRGEALQKIAEHLVKEAASKMVADIGPMAVNGTCGSVKGDAKSLFAGGYGSAGQSGGSGSVSLGGE